MHLLKEIESKEPKIKQCDTVSIGILNDRFTIVKESDFDPDCIKIYLKEVTGANKRIDDVFKADFVASHGVYICYSYEKSFELTCKSIFGNPSFCHFITAMLRSATGTDKDVIHICQEDNKMVACCTKLGRLHLINSFDTTANSNQSTLYYARLLTEAMRSDWNEVQLVLSGSGAIKELHKSFSQYTKNVGFSADRLHRPSEALIDEARLAPLRMIYRCA